MAQAPLNRVRLLSKTNIFHQLLFLSKSFSLGHCRYQANVRPILLFLMRLSLKQIKTFPRHTKKSSIYLLGFPKRGLGFAVEAEVERGDRQPLEGQRRFVAVGSSQRETVTRKNK